MKILDKYTREKTNIRLPLILKTVAGGSITEIDQKSSGGVALFYSCLQNLSVFEK